MSSYGRGDVALYSLTLFVSAALLFIVEPMFAKMVLPLLGGAPAVWNACLVFYQVALLAGYLYAHLSLKWLGARRQAMLHLALMGLAWVALPIHVVQGWLPPATTFPAPWLWLLLAASLGLPFLAVSASAPMLQAWFAQTRKSALRDPYFLYAASNLGSLLALLAYPLVIEANLPLTRQTNSWAIGYGLLMGLIAACAVRLWRSPAEVTSKLSRDTSPPALASPSKGVAFDRAAIYRRLRWLALSLVPSSLLMGVTAYISAEVTPMPFLWVVPLALYMLTFVLVFARRTILPLRWMVRLQPTLIVVAAGSLLCSASGLREVILLGTLHLATFFVTAMVCHGQLAADRPPPSELTGFYLWMSLGGVVGGLFSALVAPLIFRSVLEYPLMMAAACLLRPRSSPAGDKQSWRHLVLPAAALFLCLIVAWGLRSDSFLSGWRFTDSPLMRIATLGLAAFAAFLLRRQPAVFGTAVAVLAAVSLWSVDTGTRLIDAQRSFFGILRVEYDPVWNIRQLLHGTTGHGQQSLVESQRREPQGYYHRTGPLGRIFEVLNSPSRKAIEGTATKPDIPASQTHPDSRSPSVEVGVLGLGVGTIAAYAEPGQRFTFYEIDPAVQRIAQNRDFFTYFADCRGSTDVVLGDARLSLENGPQRRFDLLIVDVFSSDSVPVHLTTREALQVYRDHLKPGGLLALHISSRYLDLEPILGNIAADLGLAAQLWRDVGEAGVVGRLVSVWVVMARRPEDLGPLAAAPWKPLACDKGPVWTDDFSNVAGALRWKSSGLHLVPWKWKKTAKAEEHALLGIALLNDGRTDEAIEHLQQSLEIDPDNAPIQFHLGVALASRGRTDEAITHLEETTILDPDNAPGHFHLGTALEQKGKKDEALEHYLRAVQIEPGYVEALGSLGRALLDSQKYDLAVACYRKALAIKPGNAEMRFNLGVALGRQGTKPSIDEALSELRQALPMAETEKNSPLAAKIKAEIRRCMDWPWDEDRKK